MRLFIKQIVGIVALAGVGLLSASAAFAQEAGGTLSLAAREASVPGGTLLLAAYLALWLLVFGYLAMIMRRQRALSRDLAALERRMDEVFDGSEND